jgi:hypothetical protein
MSIVGVFETGVRLGTVNDQQIFTPATSKSLQHNFASPMNLWSRAYLQGVEVNDSDGAASIFVAQFVDKQGAHTGQFRPGIFSPNCTSVTFNLFTRNCIATVVCTTEIFG